MNLLYISVIKPTFMIGIWKNIKTSLNNKTFISFPYIKLLIPLIFAPKMMELWSFFQFCFWGPLKLLRPLKKAQILDSWPLTVPLKTRPWIRLVLKKCPVSNVQYVWLKNTYETKSRAKIWRIHKIGIFFHLCSKNRISWIFGLFFENAHTWKLHHWNPQEPGTE